LMTSLDLTRKFLVKEGNNKLEEVIRLSKKARQAIDKIDGLKTFSSKSFDSKGCFGFDETKLGINVTGLGLTGLFVYDILKEAYNIQIEMGDAHNILAILSVGDTEKRVNQLIAALNAISNKYKKEALVLPFKRFNATSVLKTPREAFYFDKERCSLRKSVGRVSGEFVMIYPPGIPILAPGEVITKEIIDYIELLKSENGTMSGLEDTNAEFIHCLKEN